MPSKEVEMSRKLAASGLPPKQADAVTEAIFSYAENRPATMADLLKAKMELENKIAKIVKAELETAIVRRK
jgi:hypothetical protein